MILHIHNIPHVKPKYNMAKFMNKIFDYKGKKYITASNKNAYFSLTKSKKLLSFTKYQLIKHIEFIIDNSYIVFNGTVYRQVIWIPMGTSCAPHIVIYFFMSMNMNSFIEC